MLNRKLRTVIGMIGRHWVFAPLLVLVMAAGCDSQYQQHHEFRRAVEIGDINQVRKDLSPKYLNYRYYADHGARGYTALHVACKEGHIEIVKLMLNAGAITAEA